MVDEAFRVPFMFDYVATFAWAASGAVVGIRRDCDLTGVFVVALLSSSGGGLIRDALFLQRTPVLLTDWVFLPLIGVAAALVSLFSRKVMRMPGAGKMVELIDAIGIPMFAVVGMQLAQERHIPLPGVVLVGLANGLGGGVFRDIVVNEMPALLRPGQFSALLLLLVGGVFLALTLHWRVASTRAADVTVVLFFVTRLLTVRFNWRTRAIRAPKADAGL